jgi:tetratricopeptide (TPR) repeat protein
MVLKSSRATAQVPAPAHLEPADAQAAEQNLVPGWLALAVLILLFVVAALVGFVIRGLIIKADAPTPATVAIAEWQEKVTLDPDDPNSLLSLGYAYQQAGQYTDALATYDAVLAIDPHNSGAMYNRGVALQAMGEPDQAESAFWEVLSVVPDHALAAKTLGEYYIDSERWTSALEVLEPVIAKRPHFADLQYLAGYASEQLGRTDDAIAYYREAVRFQPGYIEATEGLERLEGGE